MQIREHAEASPDKPAVILYPSGTTVTFGEMEQRANQLAHLFGESGLGEGDAVAILMENNEHVRTCHRLRLPRTGQYRQNLQAEPDYQVRIGRPRCRPGPRVGPR